MGLGMFLFGYTMAIGANAVLCAFLQGVMMVGVLIGIFATLAYGLDAFRNQSSEIFIMNMLFKARFSSSLIPCLSTDSFVELHVLRPFELRQSLGGVQRPRTDHVCFRRDFHLPGTASYSGIHLWEKTQELVVETRCFRSIEDGDKGSEFGFGVI